MKEWWNSHKDDVLLAVLILYVISLAVVTVDTLFGPWLFPPKLDRQIAEQIKKLGSSNPAEQSAAVQDLINDKGDFAVPALIRLIKKPSAPEQAKANAFTVLSKITEQNFGNNVQAWSDWFEKNKYQFP